MLAIVDLFRHSGNSRAFKAGDVFFHEGDDGGCMYVVLEGDVEIRRNGRVLELVGAGDVFGEMELVEQQPRFASAVAISDGVAVSISEKQFSFLVCNTPHFATELIRYVAQRLRRQYAA
ncbi:MAG TPA: Crp/Fnr family transcriptional regulator [Candidatus Elarobacter sp.]|jgi:CRP-like cAMP-binding protein